MLSLWDMVSAYASSLALLIPIGLLGLFRWGMWLVKRIPAMFYRPIRNDYNTTATIVTPVYQEDPVLFRKAIESWLVNRPERIIAIVDVTDTVSWLSPPSTLASKRCRLTFPASARRWRQASI